MSQPEVVRPEQLKLAPRPRWERPADVDELTWKGLKNVTRWMLVQKYGPTVEQLRLKLERLA